MSSARRSRSSTSRSSSGPRRPDGKHEVAHGAPAPRPARRPSSSSLRTHLVVEAFPTTRSCVRPRGARSRAGVGARLARPDRSGSRSPPGSAGAAPTRPRRSSLANATLAARSGPTSCTTARRPHRGGRPVLPPRGPAPRLRRRVGARTARVPGDFVVLLVLPEGATKTSTADVYRAFDERRRARGVRAAARALIDALGRVGARARPRRAAANDLASSPLAVELERLGAFRADVTARARRLRPLRGRTKRASVPRRARGRPGERSDSSRAGAHPLARGSGGHRARSRGWQDDLPRYGAWPSGKATGFGPVIPGSNPGAPASMPAAKDSDAGAVVMAAGARHAHALRGRSTSIRCSGGAWWTGFSPPPASSTPIRWWSWPGVRQLTPSSASPSPCRRSRAAQATPCAAPGVCSKEGETCSSSRAIPPSSRRSCSETSSTRTAGRGGRDRPLVRAGEPGS